MSEPQRGWLKPAVDFIPLTIFLLAYLHAGLFAATAALMISVTVVSIVYYISEKSIPIMPLVTAGLVLVFGGLTLALDDERFIKMKPTIVQGLFSIVMFGGLIIRRPVLKHLFGQTWQLTEKGWQKLTFRFGFFFLFSGLLNEVVWRTQTTDTWVIFKVFGLLALTFLFIISQIWLIRPYLIVETDKAKPTDLPD